MLSYNCFIVGDNFAPLVSQVLHDYFLAPEYIHLPRRMLRGGDFDVNHRSHGVGSSNNPAHLQLMDDLMTDSTLGLAEADGHCFNRVVWGYGAHVLYYDTLVTMRRLVADFTHKFIQKVYKLSEPVEFKTGAQHVTASHSHTGHLSQNLTHNVNFNFHGLKIVFFTRGSSGKGRTMQREASLVQALRDHGALVLFCCDFSKATLQDQLSYAVHADVVSLFYLNLLLTEKI